MQLKNFLVAACMALPVLAESTNSTDIAPKLQTRLAQIDIGYKTTYLSLNQAVSGNGNATIDVRALTAATEDGALDKNQPTAALPDTTQLVLCQAYHSLALSGIELNSAFVENLDSFSKSQRHSIASTLSKVSSETSRFSSQVARKALSYCYDTIRYDEKVINNSLQEAMSALRN
ncbi:hypothetical protein N7541_002669 [Penicillium brevicompactum]|uniref:Uncharacterized protein n=1 Tax=Penicillium brevicompactum TaxID=5074 RepID=A0A9W9V0D1_PENBR|nr:hypothetical protein N7541_002669 [Penicillium brevicompactum]